mmetsp:Transcript_24571/g.82707  ORF Transcript_24571/g.82707 Transcript_24571/m.82707 type:complete len:241 (+) Transcript_24571:407-1129(+)
MCCSTSLFATNSKTAGVLNASILASPHTAFVKSIAVGPALRGAFESVQPNMNFSTKEPSCSSAKTRSLSPPTTRCWNIDSDKVPSLCSVSTTLIKSKSSLRRSKSCKRSEATVDARILELRSTLTVAGSSKRARSAFKGTPWISTAPPCKASRTASRRVASIVKKAKPLCEPVSASSGRVTLPTGPHAASMARLTSSSETSRGRLSTWMSAVGLPPPGGIAETRTRFWMPGRCPEPRCRT